jgi:hypothetical protein
VGTEPPQVDPAQRADEWETRLRRASLDVERKRRVWVDAKAERDRLVVQGWDARLTAIQIAAVAAIDPSRVSQIVAEWAAAEGRAE